MAVVMETTRAERVAEAQRLLDEGLTRREIAERLGVGYSTVAEYFADPDHRKHLARRRAYGGTCPKCDGPRDGSAGHPYKPDSLCAYCRAAEPHSVERAMQRGGPKRVWTHDKMLEALRSFHAQHGTSSIAAYRKLAGPDLPSGHLFVLRFDSWNNARVLAGLPPTAPKRGYTRTTQADCADALRRVHDLTGTIPTVDKYDRFRCEWPALGLPSSSLIRTRFDRWATALQEAFPDES